MEDSKGMSLFAYIIAFVIIVWVISAITGGCGFGGFGFNRGGCGYGGDNLFENYKAIVDAQKTEIINTATTQYNIEQQAAATRELINAQSNALATKIDFYEYQNLRDAVAERDRKILQLEGQIYSDAKFNALSNQISEVRCNMLTKPNVTGVGVACPNTAILNGLGLNSLNNSCGCGSVV
ncbi:TPA: hypothetical protein CPT96_03265 [Candidatus Gastranaerophilales bacterium HUM_10]|nr:MAG TPA: hypothetical protein CPT96_03265 [Candidatus Gastranaerophilales bacterium HUM_10]